MLLGVTCNIKLRYLVMASLSPKQSATRSSIHIEVTFEAQGILVEPGLCINKTLHFNSVSFDVCMYAPKLEERMRMEYWYKISFAKYIIILPQS